MSRWKPGYLYCIFVFTLHTFPYVYRSMLFPEFTCCVHASYIVSLWMQNSSIMKVCWFYMCLGQKYVSRSKQVGVSGWASDLSRMVSTILSSTTRARSLQWSRFGQKGFGCWRSCDPEEDAGKAKGWSKQSHKLEANQSRPNHSNYIPKKLAPHAMPKSKCQQSGP